MSGFWFEVCKTIGDIIAYPHHYIKVKWRYRFRYRRIAFNQLTYLQSL